MSFGSPLMLALAALVALLLAWSYVRMERLRTARDLAYSDVTFFREAIAPRTWIPGALRGAFFLALAAGALAVGRLHVSLPLPVRDGAVFICVDTSGSMRSTDVEPTRAQAAAAAAREFIRATPDGTRIGIIAFASSAVVVQPLTADRAEALASVDAIPPPNGATAIGDALRLAQAQFPPAGHRVVVLITDGVNNAGVDPADEASALGNARIPVYTIGIGTPNGDIIAGEQSTIDEGALEGYASSSGGAYARAENASQLRAALARLGRSTMIERRDADATLACAAIAGLLCAGTLLAGLATGRVS